MPNGPPSKLDGWKEIAAYLGRDVTTAIRWEHERKLPVHRVPGGKRGAVYAYPQEIDHWLGEDGTEPGAESLKTAGEATGAALAHKAGVPSSAERAGATGRGDRRRLLAWALAIASVAGVTLAVGALRGGNGTVRPGSKEGGDPATPGGIDRVEYRRSEIVARDVAGRELWRYVFGVPLKVDAPGTRPSPRHVVVDLDGDGASEVVVSVGRWVTPAGTRDELLAFSSTGRVLWRLQLDDVVSFRGGSFGPPWTDGHVVAYHVDGDARIAWSQNSAPSWPSLLTVLDGSGRRISTFVHSGSTYALAAVDRPVGPMVLVGGVSNSNRAAGLFVLDGRGAAGHSSEPVGSAYECLRCPPGRPLRYFLFPPSELNGALGRPYNVVFRILLGEEGFDISTREGGQGRDADPLPAADQRFVFARDFELLHASQDDSWPVHEQLERSGKLDHSVADCPMYRNPPPVRAWDPKSGWRDLTPVGGARVTVGPRASSR